MNDQERLFEFAKEIAAKIHKESNNFGQALFIISNSFVILSALGSAMCEKNDPDYVSYKEILQDLFEALNTKDYHEMHEDIRLQIIEHQKKLDKKNESETNHGDA